MTTDILKKLWLPEGCKRVLCAVSGGADSVCLVHLLKEHSKELGVEVCAAHFEHGIRGEESLRDADFVKSLCEKMGVELYRGSGDTPGYARKEHMSLEEAARALRYRFLDEAADKLSCEAIATAHNADDNVETIIFNLTRGSGGRGLCGIPPRRGRLIRPLLGVTRAEIEAYLEKNAIAYVTDSSNASDDYSRNLIRHQVIPVLKSINPELSAAAMRTAKLLREDEDCLGAMAESFIREHFENDSLPTAALSSLHTAVSSRVLRMLCPQSLSDAHVGALMELTGGVGLGYCDVPGLRVRREQGRLYFAENAHELIGPVEIRAGESCIIPQAGVKIRAYKGQYGGEIHGLFKTYWVKCESICGKLICSSRLPGDKISPQGRNCTKSLKAIFTEKKMTQRQRDHCPVIRDDRGVLILVGHAVDRRCRPQIGDMALCIEVENLE